MKIEIHTPIGTTKVLEENQPITVEELLPQVVSECPYDVYSCRIQNQNARLTTRIEKDCSIELCDMKDASGNMTYQVSLVFLYIKAIQDIFGEDTPVTIANSLNKGLYTVIRIPDIDEDSAVKIQTHMEQMVKENLPFEERTVLRMEMQEIMMQNGWKDKLRLLDSAVDLQEAKLCTLQDHQEIFYNNLVPSTGYLKYFEVRRYKNGMLLRFPHPSKPDEIPPYHDQKLLYAAFSEANRWDKFMGVNLATDLNERIKKNELRDLVLLSEALHEKRIAEIADTIHQSGKRIILIAGPSSSGKTTFAKRLCIQLQVLGLHPLYLGTDDYFKERNETPLDENGEKDFECLEAVDVPLFDDNMNDLLAGKRVDLPTFDFRLGTKVFGKRIQSIEATQPIVIEGIHALNPNLTPAIHEDQKFRIYISPLTQLNIDEHNRIPTTDARMLRRLVRDYQYRGHDARSTIEEWPKVRAGEEKHIFPFNDQADEFFNSHCLYEIAVLKKHAIPLLNAVRPEEKEYGEAHRMLEFLEFFREMEDESMIPNNSILREFIGGSIFLK